jgi:hypothetical protein
MRTSSLDLVASQMLCMLLVIYVQYATAYYTM